MFIWTKIVANAGGHAEFADTLERAFHANDREKRGADESGGESDLEARPFEVCN